MQARNIWKPEQNATRRAEKCVLLLLLPASIRATAAYNDTFTCLLHPSLSLPFVHEWTHLPECSSPKPPPTMEAKKKSTPGPASAGAAPPPEANGYFNSVLSASPAANARDAKQTDLYSILNKQNSRGQNGAGIADGKSQGSPTKGRVDKDGKPFYPNESSESPYFDSSVNYGGRDFYDSSPHKQANGSSKNYKEDNPDGSLATRGDWWQGSLYY